MFDPSLRPHRIGRSRPLRRKARLFPLVWDALEERRLLSGFTVSYRVQTSAADTADAFSPGGQTDRDDESFTGQQDVDQEVQAEDLIDPLSEVSSQASTTVTWTGIPSDTTGTIAFAASSSASDPGKLLSSGVTYNQTDMTFKSLERGWLTLHYTAEPSSNGAPYAFNHINILSTPSPLGNQGSIPSVGTSKPYDIRLLIPANTPLTINMVSETRLNGQISEDVATSSEFTLEFQTAIAQVAVSSDFNPSTYGQSVTFTATATSDPSGGAVPTGSVDFYDGENLIGSADLVNGVATFSTDTLEAGDHHITARYSGDESYGPSKSDDYLQSVKKAATFIIGKFPLSIVYGQTLVNDAVVFVPTPTPTLPTGELDLYDTSTFPIATADPFGGIGYEFETKGLSAGLHHFGVVYSGDSNFESSPLYWDVTVSPAPLKVTADSFDIDHGDPIPALTYKITGFVNNDTAANLIGSPDLSTKAKSDTAAHYPIDIAIGTLADPNYKITLVPGTLTVHPKVLDVQVEWGGRSMSILGLKRDLPFAGIKAIDAIFSDDVYVDQLSLTLKSSLAPVQAYVVKSFDYDIRTHTARWTLLQPLDGDRPSLTLDSDGVTTDGHIGIRANPDIFIRAFSRQFAVLPGDFDGNGVVNSQDLVGVRNQINGTGDSKQLGWADFDGNNTVDLNDYNLIRKRIGQHL